MKISFIDPPDFVTGKKVERLFGCNYSNSAFPNIFSLYQAAVLEANGYDVGYFDMATERWGRGRLRRFLSADDSGAYVFHSVNLSLEGDLTFYKMIRIVKPDTFVIFTGPAPTYFKEKFLCDDRCLVIRGETEESILELAHAIRQQKGFDRIRGASFRKDRVIIDNPPRPPLSDMDKLPYPARHLLREKLYYNPKLLRKPFTVVETSRNCSYRCIFCVPNSRSFAHELEYKRHNDGMKPPIRMRSARNVIDEFKLLAKKGYKSVSIIDDQFLWDDKRTVEICNGIKDLKIDWGCLARADRINNTVANSMKRAGCAYVDIGAESFRQEVLDDIGKGLKVEQIFEAMRIMKKAGILVKINLMLGVSPLQNEQTIREDIKIAKSLDVDAVMFSIAEPFPGTKLYEIAMSDKLFANDAYIPVSAQQRSIIEYPHLPKRDIEKLVRYANRSFYIRPRFFMKNLWRLTHPLNIYHGISSLKRKMTG